MTHNTQAPLAIRITTAAAMVGLSRRTLERLIEAGTLKSRRIGGARLILIRDLRALLATDRPAATAK